MKKISMICFYSDKTRARATRGGKQPPKIQRERARPSTGHVDPNDRRALACLPMRSSLRLGLLVLAGAISDALQLCAPAPSRAAAVYLPPPSSCALLGPRRRDFAIARSRTSRLKLCVVSSPVLEEASAADAVVPATSYPAVPTYRECLVFALNAVGIYAAPTNPNPKPDPKPDPNPDPDPNPNP